MGRACVDGEGFVWWDGRADFWLSRLFDCRVIHLSIGDATR
jgi:hypothetical protein